MKEAPVLVLREKDYNVSPFKNTEAEVHVRLISFLFFFQAYVCCLWSHVGAPQLFSEEVEASFLKWIEKLLQLSTFVVYF